ncbi:MAG: DUF134 domain-containing protein [Oscillospiraceae bacterium]|jgi:predicted DNA-binding protein (UPF0251 family)|nr:DUF134 domain-containing protein [Oscillospiraceae bacterium]
MARPQRCRRICSLPEYTHFEPVGRPPCDGEYISLSLDEFEAVRLMDYEGCTHEQCASVMQISRTTATEIYESARRKLAEVIVSGRPLIIGGGSVRLCDHADPCGQNLCPSCGQALSGQEE